MEKKDDLTLLARSLSKSERKYFTLLASLEGESSSKSYMELFAQMTDDPPKTKKGGQRKANAQYALRNYLYDQILFTLRGYAEDETDEMKVDKQLLNIRVLVSKNQFSLARKEILRVLKHVRSAEMFTHEMELLSVQYEFLSRLLYDKNDGVSFDILAQQELEAADRYKNFRQYFHLYNNVRQLMIVKGGGHLNEAEQKNLRASIGHPLLRTELNAQSLKAKYFFYLTWQYYYQAEGDSISLYRVTGKLMRFCERNKTFMQLRPFQHLSAIYTHLQASYDTGHLREFPAMLEKMMEIKIASPVQKNYQAAYYAYHHFLYSFYNKDKKQLQLLVDKYLQQRPGMLSSIRKDFLMILDLNTMLADLSCQAYAPLLDRINDFLNNKDFNIRHDFTAKVMLLNIVVHFEHKNHLLLQTMIRNTTRYITGQKTLKNELRVLRWLKKLVEFKLYNRGKLDTETKSFVEFVNAVPDDYPVFYQVMRDYAVGKKKG